ncbi:hypothetical protein ACFVTX_08760 [Agromyces sp. NPDC058136]|uniref:hypothetical protein n=1 Tax=Agromyces sp. NPDC058136 TaxID=3346354 RepID=UPI0036DDD46C
MDDEEADIPEKPIKVDLATDELVSELAYLLKTTKKAVVREAVIEFAESRRPDRDEGGRVAYSALPLDERLALRRPELLRLFDKHGAANPRVLDDEYREHADHLVLLVETDLAMGGGAAPFLAEQVQRMLGSPVEVISATGLSLFNPAGLTRAIAESRPL